MALVAPRQLHKNLMTILDFQGHMYHGHKYRSPITAYFAMAIVKPRFLHHNLMKILAFQRHIYQAQKCRAANAIWPTIAIIPRQLHHNLMTILDFQGHINHGHNYRAPITACFAIAIDTPRQLYRMLDSQGPMY